ncbi:MAG: methyltransferase domain-containing protein [Elusimicrobiales bacterium]
MKKFWEFKSKKYPKPFDHNILDETKRIISIIENLGVDFKNKKIIDIGCGTGIYGLVLSELADEVFCLDFSKNMIDILKNEADKRGIKNSKCIVCDFKDFDAKEYEKHFDISFASMTPAIKDEKDVYKMELLSKKWCVYIGWAGKRENKIADELYSLFGLKPHLPTGFFDVKKILKDKKRKFKTHIFETSWKWKGSIDEAMEEFALRIELDIKDVDRNKIKEFLKSKFPSGDVEYETLASEGIIVWEV